MSHISNPLTGAQRTPDITSDAFSGVKAGASATGASPDGKNVSIKNTKAEMLLQGQKWSMANTQRTPPFKHIVDKANVAKSSAQSKAEQLSGLVKSESKSLSYKIKTLLNKVFSVYKNTVGSHKALERELKEVQGGLEKLSKKVEGGATRGDIKEFEEMEQNLGKLLEFSKLSANQRTKALSSKRPDALSDGQLRHKREVAEQVSAKANFNGIKSKAFSSALKVVGMRKGNARPPIPPLPPKNK
jgi:hypothetical protein